MSEKWKTHEVANQYTELADFNLFTTDIALMEYFKGVKKEWVNALEKAGKELGSNEAFDKGALANTYTPVLKSFDNRGNRRDFVEFHPSWHYFMGAAKNSGMISAPFETDEKDRWMYAAVEFMLRAQIEDGSMCPTTMTQGSIPLIMREPKLWEQLKDKLFSHEYDERDVPIEQKKSVWIGMGMTEKQGGSDVRQNATVATPVGKSGRGEEYTIRGHKWFFSAPMCDGHLVTARTSDTDELGCFFVPRWKPDGTKNPVQVQRLKEKVGNKSNSSSEVEFQDAYGVLMGEEGRGIPTIIEMANYTRLSCVLGSAGIMRQATVQAIAYTRKRVAFGKKLYDQPLMRNVLTDFALESEAATHISMKLAQAFEGDDNDISAKAWKRLITPAAKYWVCKRAESLTAEAMETFGGNGYVDDGIMARLFKEAPVNSIWEGSGNVMCLDVLRAMKKEPELIRVILGELQEMAAGDMGILSALQDFTAMALSNPETLEMRSRILTEKLMLLVQAALMKKHAPEYMSDAFIQTRIVDGLMTNYGAFNPNSINHVAILERSFPGENTLHIQSENQGKTLENSIL